MPSDNRFFQAVMDALAQDRLTLPTLPDVALRIRESCESADASAAGVSAELARDPAMAARVLRVASSAAHGGRRVDNLQVAVTRLGLQMTRLLVTSFALEQAFACQSPELRLRLRSQWSRSVEVAALSRVLAGHFTVLKPDLAMLAGLTHDIGALALIRAADQHKPAPPAPEVLEDVLERFSARVGRMVLQAWEFPRELQEVPVHSADFRRWHEGGPDYADVVTVALLQCDATGARRWWSLDRSTVPAFSLLDISPGVESMEMPDLSEDCAQTAQLLAA